MSQVVKCRCGAPAYRVNSLISSLPHYRCQNCKLILCGLGDNVGACLHPLRHTGYVPLYDGFAAAPLAGIIPGPMGRGLL